MKKKSLSFKYIISNYYNFLLYVYMPKTGAREHNPSFHCFWIRIGETSFVTEKQLIFYMCLSDFTEWSFYPIGLVGQICIVDSLPDYSPHVPTCNLLNQQTLQVDPPLEQKIDQYRIPNPPQQLVAMASVTLEVTQQRCYCAQKMCVFYDPRKWLRQVST